MRRYLGIIISILLVLGVLIGLNAASHVEFDRPRESELEPIRSSYSAGPTGTRAFYQLLEETGRPVTRWRESYLELAIQAKDGVLVVVGPFPLESYLPSDEARALQKWIAAGGRALIVSRYPRAQFGDPVIHSDEIKTKNQPWRAQPEQLVDNNSDRLIVQPTELTRNLRGLALSHLAARLTFRLPETEETKEEDGKTTPTPDASGSQTPPPPQPTPEEEPGEILYAPVIHLGDHEGAVLADFGYGRGRVIFLSDPFVIANNGIARGANLTLVSNLIDSLGAAEKGATRRIYFDEFHHGYRSESNPLVSYFRGTPMPWLLLQGLLFCLLLVYTQGKRFARPLPLPHIDRHSPLEFVGSMANLQQAARARDLALENIYPRFKAQLCRRLGLSSRAREHEIVAGLHRQRLPVSEIELREAISEGERVLRGEQIDDAKLVKLVARMRRITNQIK